MIPVVSQASFQDWKAGTNIALSFKSTLIASIAYHWRHEHSVIGGYFVTGVLRRLMLRSRSLQGAPKTEMNMLSLIRVF